MSDFVHDELGHFGGVVFRPETIIAGHGRDAGLMNHQLAVHQHIVSEGAVGGINDDVRERCVLNGAFILRGRRGLGRKVL